MSWQVDQSSPVSWHSRWLALFGEDRLEVKGVFTAQDLRLMADWLDNPNHPCIQGLPVIDLKLSPMKPLKE